MQGGEKHAGRLGVLIVIWCVLSGMGAVRVVSAHHDGHTGAKPVTVPARELLEIYECTTCHRLTEPYRLIGPSLWKIGERADAAAIRASILTPDAMVTPGYPAGLMRARLEEVGFYKDIARQPDILDRIVAYLVQGAAPPEAAQSQPPLQPIPTPQSADGRRGVPVAGLDTTPVTKAQYAAFMTDQGYKTKRYWDRAGWALVIKRRKRTQPLGWQVDRDDVSPEPVIGVTWYEAEAYCRWVGKELPTEQEWERGCKEAPAWQGPTLKTNLQWEWTAEAVWRGGHGRVDGERCTARVPSHPALDGPHTGFRCRAIRTGQPK